MSQRVDLDARSDPAARCSRASRAQRAAAPILLVGYEDRDNLGLRYLLSSLAAEGYRAEIVRFSADPTPIVARAVRERPLIVGFSMIFQYMAPDFGRVIAALRAAGVECHVTTGGHYPSFDWDEVLRRMPGLDSVVRFEGEQTLVELADRLATGAPWQDVAGIACRHGAEPRANPLRPPLDDLDRLPWPDRSTFDYESERLPTAAILGSRGCPWDCTFCSIRPFYEAQGGPLRRFRSPSAVVDEMATLHRDRGISLFLFQDDDFLAGGRKAQRWACEIADGLIEAGLAGRVAWKVSCRSNEVDEPTLAHLMRGGLTHVYLGVEAGDPDDLADMRKRMAPDAHFAAAEILRRLGLSFDFGFMLLQPYSTIARVRNNVTFLRQFVGDGYAVAGFCRMLPYAGTPTKTRLEAEGRLRGTPFQPDYRFLDPKLDLFYDWMVETFHERNFTDRGLSHLFRAALFEARLQLAGNPMPPAIRALLHHLCAWCNRVATYVLDQALDHIERTSLADLARDPGPLARLSEHARREERRIVDELDALYRVYLEGQRGVSSAEDGMATSLGGFTRSWTHFDGVEA